MSVLWLYPIRAVARWLARAHACPLAGQLSIRKIVRERERAGDVAGARFGREQTIGMQNERLRQESCSFDAAYASGGDDLITRNDKVDGA